MFFAIVLERPALFLPRYSGSALPLQHVRIDAHLCPYMIARRRARFFVSQTPVVAGLSHQLAPSAASPEHLPPPLADVPSLHVPPSQSVRRAESSSVVALRVAAVLAEQHRSATSWPLTPCAAAPTCLLSDASSTVPVPVSSAWCESTGLLARSATGSKRVACLRTTWTTGTAPHAPCQMPIPDGTIRYQFPIPGFTI